MADHGDIEARLAAVEVRVEEVAAERRLTAARVEDVAVDAAAARHLAAAHDRDLSDLGVKADANRRAINALGEQTRARFDHLEGRFDHLEGRFDDLEGRFGDLEGRFGRLEQEMRHGFAVTAAGQRQIVALLTDRIDRDGGAEGAP